MTTEKPLPATAEQRAALVERGYEVIAAE